MPRAIPGGYQPDTKASSARRADFDLLRRVVELERAVLALRARDDELDARDEELQSQIDDLTP